MPIEDRYIGDGVYVSFDGYNIMLELRAQPPTAPITTIALDPEVFTALVQFQEDALKSIDKGGEQDD